MTDKMNTNWLPPAPDLQFENAFWKAGISQVGGIDEAGRGALAGPVSAAVVVLPNIPHGTELFHGVRDSKQMTPAQRDEWKSRIEEHALAWGVGLASAREIDLYGIVPSTRLAAERALRQLPSLPQHLLLDYLQLPDISTPQTWLVKGDCRSLSIAAASILAKTYRDTLLIALAERYPCYDFQANKGYGTAGHRRAIEEYGPCPDHRMTFSPMREMETQKSSFV